LAHVDKRREEHPTGAKHLLEEVENTVVLSFLRDTEILQMSVEADTELELEMV
jgi:hypothetical protein